MHSGPSSSKTYDLFVVSSLNASGNTKSLVFYETQDGARTWQPIATLAVSDLTGNVLPVALIDATHWIVGVPAVAAGRARFAITQDGGRTWSYLDSPGFAGATTLAFATPELGWALVTFSACRGFKSDCFYETRLYRTLDGGPSWSPSSPGS